MNLCTDRLVLALADPAQIHSLSYLAADPNSMIKIAAQSIPLNQGHLEEMLAQNVDYIFTSEFDSPRFIERLRQYGKNVHQFITAKSIHDAKNNIKTMSKLLRHEQRGNDLIEQLSTISKTEPRANNRTIMLGANNYISGQNSLSSHLIETLGFQNIASEANISGYGQISMEQLIDLQPDVIILNKYSEDYSRAQAVLNHPVFKQLSKQSKIYYVPTREWICGDTALVKAARRLM